MPVLASTHALLIQMKDARMVCERIYDPGFGFLNEQKWISNRLMTDRDIRKARKVR